MKNIDLANLTGASSGSVWRWRCGILPRRAMAYKIAAALKVSTSYLITGEPGHPDWTEPTCAYDEALAEAKIMLAGALGVSPDRVEITVTVN
jgi:transcriptional regulator with XRE-family HTH domain